MQFVEDSIVGVRSAVITLSRRETPLRFQLYPMLHIGDRGFYREVHRRLRECDLIVAEGGPDTFAARALTLSYRLAHRNKRLNVDQQNSGLDLLSLGKPIVMPDMGAEEFDAGWRRVPLKTRVAVMVVAPLYGVWLAVFGTRRWLGKHAMVEDLRSNEEVIAGFDDDDLAALLVHDRDRLLIEELLRIHDERCEEAVTVAVVYGAEHMRAVTTALLAKHRYLPRDAEWVSVLAY